MEICIINAAYLSQICLILASYMKQVWLWRRLNDTVQRWLRWNLMFWPPELSWELCVAEMLRLNSEDAFKLQTDGAHCRDSCLAPILTIQHWLDSWLGLETNLSEDLRNTTRAFSVVVKLQILRRFVASSIDSWLWEVQLSTGWILLALDPLILWIWTLPQY